MDIVSVAFIAYSTLDKAETIASAARILPRILSPKTVDDLFKECFQRAVKRNAKSLSHFTHDKTVNGIDVQQSGLAEALSKLKEASFGLEEPNKLAERLAPIFLDAIILPGRPQVDEATFPIVGNVLSNALEDFVSRLPSSPEAYRELNLKDQAEAAREREHQHDFRNETSTNIEEIITLVREVRNEVRKSQYLDPKVIQHESEWIGLRNPFRLLKAEDFSDPSVFSDLFEEPEPYDLVRGSDNLILEGGRGCGKSMLLKSLQLPVALEIERKRRNLDAPLTLGESNLDYWGVYIKLARGCFDDIKPDGIITEEAALQFFQHFFNMELLKASADALNANRAAGHIQVADHEENTVCREISNLVRPDDEPVDTFQNLRRLAKSEQRLVQKYLGTRRIGGSGDYEGELTYVHDFPQEICDLLTSKLAVLQGFRVFFLLDEFENLAEFQQTVVNTIVKLRPQSLAIKVATRARGVKSEVDLNGEPIQTPRDYVAIPLDYNPEGVRYKTLLTNICARRLASEGYATTDVSTLLPSGERYLELGGVEAAKERIAELYGRDGSDWSELAPDKQRDFMEKQAVALIFREHEKAEKPRHYSGFTTFATLSSGIVSSFLELCKTSVYLATSDGVDIQNGESVPPYTQNEAVYITSRTSLDVIVRNIPETGALIHLLVRNLADIFRAKLLYHQSEPEAARIVVTDPLQLGAPEWQDLKRVIDDAVRWSVLHDEESAAYQPRRREAQTTSGFVFNRMLAPILKISHRYRWRTEFNVSELAALISAQAADGVKARLVERHTSGSGHVDPTLFDSIHAEINSAPQDGDPDG